MMPLLQVRFPHPDFLSGYIFPETPFPAGESILLAVLDPVILVLLLAASWFALYRYRSRTGVFAVSMVSLLYFGFIRGGCPCPIGLIQPIAALALHPEATLGVLSLAVFLIPLAAALWKGRLYCSSVCPIGAVQELLLVKPARLPPGLSVAFSVIPGLYLGVILAAAYASAPALACLADPFVTLFHFGAPGYRFAFLAVFAAAALFLYRPYCRFFCPYGLILRAAALISGTGPSITSGQCVNCGLCDASCPAEAVRALDNPAAVSPADRKRFYLVIMLFPIAAGLLAAGGGMLGKVVSTVHPDVQLMRVLTVAAGKLSVDDPVTAAFLEREEDREEAIRKGLAVEQSFRFGIAAAGALSSLLWLSGAVALLSRRRIARRTVLPGSCFSCAKCIAACPVERSQKKNLVPADRTSGSPGRR